jgi:hypothetical protein
VEDGEGGTEGGPGTVVDSVGQPAAALTVRHGRCHCCANRGGRRGAATRCGRD